MKPVLGLPLKNFEVVVFGSLHLQVTQGHILDQAGELMGRYGNGARGLDTGGAEPLVTDFEVRGRNMDAAVAVGFEEHVGQDGHGSPLIHHTENGTYGFCKIRL